MTNETPEALLAFWFAPEVRPLWFNATAAFDQALKERYLATYRAACVGELDDWQQTAAGALALVIVLDQFPLNMFRGTPESFAGEAASREVAQAAVERGFDQQLEAEQQAFLYMPFMHSESLADQERAVELFEQAGLKDNLKWARHHRDLIRRFGRFPHRNAILGRENTPQESAYLASKEAFHG